MLRECYGEREDPARVRGAAAHLRALLGEFAESAQAEFAYSRTGKDMSTARHAMHLKFDISPNALEIRVQSSKCEIWCAIDYTHIPLTLYPRRGSSGISDIPPRRLNKMHKKMTYLTQT
jgi:hypothetical protein